MTTNKNILLIGGIRYLQKKLQCLEGIKTTLLISKDKIRQEDFQDNYQILALSDNYDEWVRIIECVHQKEKFDYLVSFDDKVHPIASIIAKKLGLHFHSSEVIAGVQNKDQMRKILENAGVDKTQSSIVTTEKDIINFGNSVGYPIILKPLNRQGSIGISKINNGDEVLAALKQTKILCGDSELIVEEFLDGQEYSVEAFSENGKHKIISITKQIKSPNTFIEIGHQTPAGIDIELQNKIEEFVSSALTAIGVGFGPTHTEIKVAGGIPRMVETHTRLGGDYIPEMVSSAKRIDMTNLWVEQVVGNKVFPKIISSLQNNNTQYSSIWYGNSEKEGILKSIKGEDAVLEREGVLQIEILHKIGEHVHPLRSSNDRIFMVRTIGDSPAQALERALDACKAIELIIE